MILRCRFAIVIAHHRGGQRTLASLKPGNIAIHGEIFAVFVMSFVADRVANIMQQRTSLQNHPRISRQMMQRLQLIEQLQTAGVKKKLADDTVLTEKDKTQLLDYLRQAHGAKEAKHKWSH